MWDRKCAVQGISVKFIHILALAWGLLQCPTMVKSEFFKHVVLGQNFEVRVTPKASRNKVEYSDGLFRVYVTTVPENGKATSDVVKLLAKALGVPKSTLILVRGETSRHKIFRIEY